jgi:thiol-disulfide isomerase/thioredoxin
MSSKKTPLNNIISILLFVAAVIYFFSPRLKSWTIMGLMAIGFFKPDIPQHQPGEKLQPVPAMRVQNIDGKMVDLQQQKGKVIFINFWATWCPPCLAELPSINEFYQKEKNNPDIVFITVDIDNNLPKSTQFMAKKGYTLPVYGLQAGSPGEKLFDDGIPATYVVDKKGNIVFSHENRANYDNDQFAQFIAGLCKQ